MSLEGSDVPDELTLSADLIARLARSPGMPSEGEV